MELREVEDKRRLETYTHWVNRGKGIPKERDGDKRREICDRISLRLGMKWQFMFPRTVVDHDHIRHWENQPEWIIVGSISYSNDLDVLYIIYYIVQLHIGLYFLYMEVLRQLEQDNGRVCECEYRPYFFSPYSRRLMCPRKQRQKHMNDDSSLLGHWHQQ